MALPERSSPERARELRARLMAMPGGDKFFRELYAEGLVDGWTRLLAVGEPLDLTGHIEVPGPHQTGYECCR